MHAIAVLCISSRIENGASNACSPLERHVHSHYLTVDTLLQCRVWPRMNVVSLGSPLLYLPVDIIVACGGDTTQSHPSGLI